MNKKPKDNVYYFESSRKKCSQDNDASKDMISSVLKEHEDCLWRFLSARLSAFSDKEDLMQEVFLRLIEQKNLEQSLSYGKEKTRAYLIIIASNLIRDMRRRHKLHENAYKYMSYQQTSSVDNRSPERLQVLRQKLAAVDKVLDELPPRNREAFRLSRFANMSYREIAKKMNVSISMVEKYIAKSLLILRDKVDFNGDRL